MPGNVESHLALIATVWGKYYHHPHSTGEEFEVQRN